MQVERHGVDAEFEQAIRHISAKLRDGTPVDVEYVMAIDWERVRALAEKAFRNKSRASKFGPVTVFVAGVKRGAA
jgi:hypothetical protein